MSGARIHVLVAFDVAREIDLAGAALALGAASVANGFGSAPGGGGFTSAAGPPRAVSDPVETRVPAAVPAPPGAVADGAAVVRIYEFGAIAWRIAFDVAAGQGAARPGDAGPDAAACADIARVVAALRADAAIIAAARTAVDAVVVRLGRAVRDAAAWHDAERYDVTVLPALPADDPPGRASLCRILRPGSGAGSGAGAGASARNGAAPEPPPPSADEIADALRCRDSRSAAEAVVIDVDGAVVVSPDARPLLDLFEFVTVQLLEMRFLDARLDDGLRKSYDVLAEPPSRLWLPGGPAAGALERVGASRIDAVLLFQHVRNAPKLVAGPWLVRTYEAAATRRRLPEWNESLLHKLDTLGTLYERIRDRGATARAETLEWIVILLIAISMALPVLV